MLHPQQSPNRWSCLPTSFAMCLNYPVDQLIALLGHDGSEIVWPRLSDPLCRRGFHIQELIFIAWRNFSRTVTPFEAIPLLRSGEEEVIDVPSLPVPTWRMPEVMQHSHGIITGATMRGQPHAVAWDGEKVYDPNGTTYPLDQFLLETYWMMK